MHEVKAEATKPVERAGLTERAAKLDETLTIFRAELEADRFAPALGKFREAVNLSRAWKELRTRVLRAGAQEAKNLLPRNWRVAETLLSETNGIEGDYAIPTELWDKVRIAQHDEVISNALYTVDRTELIESVEKAREQVNGLLLTHPAEPRLQAKLQELKEKLNPTTPVQVEAPAAASSEKPQVDPPVAKPPDPAVEAVAASAGQRVKIAIAGTAWDKVKTVATVAVSAAMIVTAVVLVWIHVRQPHRLAKTASRIANRIEVETPASSPDAATVAYTQASEEKAWQIVETTQRPEDLQFFLKVYPKSLHAVRARVKLEALQAQESNQEDEEREDWKALDHSDPKALESFLVAHPDGAHAKAVQDELGVLRNKAR